MAQCARTLRPLPCSSQTAIAMAVIKQSGGAMNTSPQTCAYLYQIPLCICCMPSFVAQFASPFALLLLICLPISSVLCLSSSAVITEAEGMNR